ncbi:MAG: hypothetical protein J7L64_09160 [Acidobacteria bacterium]|nr:hypothetical protein [Acidobacteriota bacterium]
MVNMMKVESKCMLVLAFAIVLSTALFSTPVGEKKIVWGFVKDKVSQKSIKGAKVSIIKGSTFVEEGKEKPPVTTVTKDSGDFYLEYDYDDAILVVDAEGYAITRRALVFNKGEVFKYKEIELSPASTVRGRIIDKDAKAPVIRS